MPALDHTVGPDTPGWAAAEAHEPEVLSARQNSRRRPLRPFEKIEHLRRTRKLVSRDCSIRLPHVDLDDKAQQPSADAHVEQSSPDRPKRTRPWKRWIGGASREEEAQRKSDPPPVDRLDVLATLHVLPTLLDNSSLPNGVVELLIDDFEEPTRQLFDVHDGNVTLVEPGTAVPWASISGPPTAWVDALGPNRDVSALRLSGDEQLARRVLAALPPHND